MDDCFKKMEHNEQNNLSVNSYFRFLRGLNRRMKVQLIARLEDSMKNQESDSSHVFFQSFGSL